jgi:hypothetical protein
MSLHAPRAVRRKPVFEEAVAQNEKGPGITPALSPKNRE